MKKQWYLLIMLAVLAAPLCGQGDVNFQVEVSTDSVLLGNYIRVSFKLENAKGDEFIAPAFEGFKVVSGPNISSSFSMINGEITQSMVYNYYLEPADVGNYYILPASIDIGETVLETAPVEILVVPNPDGIIQQPETTDSPLHLDLEGFDFPGFMEFPGLEQFRFLPEPDEKPAPSSPKKKKKKRKTVKI